MILACRGVNTFSRRPDQPTLARNLGQMKTKLDRGCGIPLNSDNTSPLKKLVRGRSGNEPRRRCESWQLIPTPDRRARPHDGIV